MVSGLFIGILFGGLLQSGQFCFVSGFRNILYQRNTRFLTALLIAVTIQSVGFFALESAGLLHIPEGNLPITATLAGGFIFGAGMVLAGCCGSGAWFRSGEGLTGTWIALFSFVVTMAAAQKGSLKLKGAFHFNTDWIENGPVWNLSEPDVIKNNLLKNGIRKDTPVVVYSENQMAALRVLWALKWAGVEDIRFLNGGLNVWMDAELPTETTLNIPVPVADFGAEIPVNPQATIAMPAEAIQAQKSGLKLISNRTWDEYTGKISGYDYIPRKGEPAGAIWGFGGKNANDMSDYYDPDGTLRNPEEIFALWKTQGIEPTDQVAFYCGTGWRASVSWFMTQLAGWENSRIYDGGWNAWQMDPALPVLNDIQSQKPAALNDYGEIIKKPGQSCKS
ncbi:YeeE/YedE thiosulfate transporter family protein [Morganella morganii]|uniref:YeeE/YedE thiosulfate transporter family protein n=1 Tax=Morganella morganii TaxID=582 RepID=UPI003784F759|nr:hypothetical protein SUGSMm_21090 [Morganella morganii subsp. sibonii]